jgi:hypothetical protein
MLLFSDPGSLSFPIQIPIPIKQPPPPNANANNAHNYYADNTARFFMHHPGSKNVHF